MMITYQIFYCAAFFAAYAASRGGTISIAEVPSPCTPISLALGNRFIFRRGKEIGWVNCREKGGKRAGKKLRRLRWFFPALSAALAAQKAAQQKQSSIPVKHPASAEIGEIKQV